MEKQQPSTYIIRPKTPARNENKEASLLLTFVLPTASVRRATVVSQTKTMITLE